MRDGTRPILRKAVQYAFAVLLVAVALVVSLAASPVFESVPYFLFWGAIIFSASQGFGPGLLAVLLALPSVEYFRTGTFGFPTDPITFAQHLLFTALGLLVAIERARAQRTRERAQLASQRLEILLESAQDFAIISLDLAGRITTWNAGAANLFGWQDSEVLGKNFNVLFTEEDRAEGIPAHELEVALRKGSAIDERWQTRQDDSRFFASGIVRPLLSAGGVAVGFLKILRDATVHRVLEQERADLLVREQAARTQLEQVNNLIIQFVAVVSHEIRNPLATIKGNVTTLLAEDVTWNPDQQREFLDIINQETDRLTELTDQLLDYTQLRSGTLGVKPERTTFDAVLKAIEPQLNMLVPEHHLVIRPPDPSPPLDIDVGRIGQVLMNLIGNAVRYCPTETTIVLVGEVEGDRLRIDVLDEGPGIPPDKRERIFDPFQQLGIDRQGETKGAGLGLSIAKGIVEAHGGRIWIDDRGDKGTTVSFTLPVVR